MGIDQQERKRIKKARVSLLMLGFSPELLDRWLYADNQILGCRPVEMLKRGGRDAERVFEIAGAFASGRVPIDLPAGAQLSSTQDEILVTDDLKEQYWRQRGIDIGPKQRSPMSLFFIIVALLAAAIICAAEGVSSTVVIILALVAAVIALLNESGAVTWPARRQ